MKGPARVAVLGLGDFGYHFACELHQLGHEVLAVDSEQDTVQEILPHVTKAAVADVSDRPALEELGIADFDIVAVCVGERLETAVLLVHHLHQLQVPRILVKVVNAEQAEIVKLVGATEVIQPEQSADRKAALLTHHPRTIDFWNWAAGSSSSPAMLPAAWWVRRWAHWPCGNASASRFSPSGEPTKRARPRRRSPMTRSPIPTS